MKPKVWYNAKKGKFYKRIGIRKREITGYEYILLKQALDEIEQMGGKKNVHRLRTSKRK